MISVTIYTTSGNHQVHLLDDESVCRQLLAYFQSHGFDSVENSDNLLFFFNGMNIGASDTITSLNLDHGDVLDAMETGIPDQDTLDHIRQCGYRADTATFFRGNVVAGWGIRRK